MPQSPNTEKKPRSEYNGYWWAFVHNAEAPQVVYVADGGVWTIQVGPAVPPERVRLVARVQPPRTL